MTPIDPPAPDILESFAEHSADVLCRVGLDDRITYVSPSCVALLGCSVEEMVGTMPPELVCRDDVPIVTAYMGAVYDLGVMGGSITVRLLRRDGLLVWAEMNARAVRDPATQRPTGAVLVMRDVSERKRMEEQLEALAMADRLTGLMNRRAFDAAMDQEWLRVVREESETSLLLVEIDHFKPMNDLYGHGMGDDCLRIIARGVARCIHRPCDIAARYSGEAFAVMLPGADLAGAAAVAERIRQCIAGMRLAHVGNPAGGGMVTVSVGVATALAFHGDTLRMPESLRMATETALYKARLGGRNRIATGILLASPVERA